MTGETIRYDDVCFVAIPYGRKRVGPEAHEVDFDSIYERVFEPAIARTELPEGGQLRAVRAKDSFFSGPIDVEMFNYIEYARFLVADVTTLNPNVMWELGVRHRARESGTALFQQLHTERAFDIQQIRTFPYEYEPELNAEQSRTLITDVLRENLKQNQVTSPVHLALRAQQLHQYEQIEPLLVDVENAIRADDAPTAIAKYRQALALHSENPVIRVRLGVLLRTRGEWEAARVQFELAVRQSPSYSEAHRELGIAQNKLFTKGDRSMPVGDDELRRAIELNPDDFDALSALGGILKRARLFTESLDCYERATEISHGHAYPLLNALKLRALAERSLALSESRQRQLRRAERQRRNQVVATPPYDAPWSFFDLAEIRMYLGDPAESLALLAQGIDRSEALTDLETHRNTLQLLADAGVSIPGLDESLSALSDAIAARTMI